MAIFEREITNRLIRIESKLVRGFEELGINIDKEKSWLTVDDEARVVYIATLGRSILVMLCDMEREGATHFGENYEIVHNGETIGLIMLTRVEIR